mmetsp:Transcript_32676/g.74106  ORF Transcript_32676/g.74106 Transcript_32676/m.74106 type:complete len:269 (+) Transcript_32676:265-1071(+)
MCRPEAHSPLVSASPSPEPPDGERATEEEDGVDDRIPPRAHEDFHEHFQVLLWTSRRHSAMFGEGSLWNRHAQKLAERLPAVLHVEDEKPITRDFPLDVLNVIVVAPDASPLKHLRNSANDPGKLPDLAVIGAIKQVGQFCCLLGDVLGPCEGAPHALEPLLSATPDGQDDLGLGEASHELQVGAAHGLVQCGVVTAVQERAQGGLEAGVPLDPGHPGLLDRLVPEEEAAIGGLETEEVQGLLEAASARPGRPCSDDPDAALRHCTPE